MYFETELSLSLRCCQREGLALLLVLRLMVLGCPSTGTGVTEVSKVMVLKAHSLGKGKFSLDSCMDH